MRSKQIQYELIQFPAIGYICLYQNLVEHPDMYLSSKITLCNFLFTQISGSRFPPKTLEVTLTCTLRFGEPGQRSAAMFEDPFCVGQNAYAQVRPSVYTD